MRKTHHHAVAGLLTLPPAAPETCGRHFRRGRETHADLGRGLLEFHHPLP
jgi:hypothetical protein